MWDHTIIRAFNLLKFALNPEEGVSQQTENVMWVTCRRQIGFIQQQLMFHLECIKDGSEDVNLNRLLTWSFCLFYALAKMLQHLQSMFVSDMWEHQAVESDWAVNYSDAEWQWTRYRLALETDTGMALANVTSYNFWLTISMKFRLT